MLTKLINLLFSFLSSPTSVETYEISLSDYYGSHDRSELTPQDEENAVDLLARVNTLLRTLCPSKSFTVTSGWRPALHNIHIGGAKRSRHIICQAVDLRDLDGDLGSLLAKNRDLLQSLGLAIENPSCTPTWVHIQHPPPRSGNIIFLP